MDNETNETNKTNGLKNGKCIDCNACGNSGCCPPANCKMLFNSPYCNWYLAELKATYTAYSKLYSLIYYNQKKYPDLFKEADDINNA